MDFSEAIKLVIEKKRVTRKEWNDIRHYVLISDYILHIHKSGEAEDTIHPWIISESDLLADDWKVI